MDLSEQNINMANQVINDHMNHIRLYDSNPQISHMLNTQFNISKLFIRQTIQDIINENDINRKFNIMINLIQEIHLTSLLALHLDKIPIFQSLQNKLSDFTNIGLHHNFSIAQNNTIRTFSTHLLNHLTNLLP